MLNLKDPFQHQISKVLFTGHLLQPGTQPGTRSTPFQHHGICLFSLHDPEALGLGAGLKVILLLSDSVGKTIVVGLDRCLSIWFSR